MKEKIKFTEEENEILTDCSSDLENLEYFEYSGFFDDSNHFKTTEDLEHVADDLKSLAIDYQKIAKILEKILKKHEKA